MMTLEPRLVLLIGLALLLVFNPGLRREFLDFYRRIPSRLRGSPADTASTPLQARVERLDRWKSWLAVAGALFFLLAILSFTLGSLLDRPTALRIALLSAGAAWLLFLLKFLLSMAQGVIERAKQDRAP